MLFLNYICIYLSVQICLNYFSFFFNGTLQRELIKSQVALTGVSKASWTDENNRALDKFIADATIKLLVIYLHPFSGLCVQYTIPSQVLPVLFWDAVTFGLGSG